MDGGNTGLLELLDLMADHFVSCLGCEVLFFPSACFSLFSYLIQIEHVALAMKARKKRQLLGLVPFVLTIELPCLSVVIIFNSICPFRVGHLCLSGY
jgi:hypothetical protein